MGKAKKAQPQYDALCKYCEKAAPLNDPDQMLCEKRGVVNAGYVCRQFRYDPLKRDPGKLPRMEALPPLDAE